MAASSDLLKHRLSALSARWQAFAASRRGALALRAGRWLFVGGLVLYLVLRLTEIGLGEVLGSLPATPWFYVLFLIAFVQLPFIETLIYRIVWDFPYRRGLVAFFKKRVFNNDVLGYSGEVYLYVWAKHHVRGARDADLLRTIRDTNIISSAASTLVAIGLLAFFVYGRHIDLQAWVGDYTGLEIALALVATIVVGVLAVRFRRYLFSMPPRQAALIFSVHSVRLLIVNALLLAQWMVVIPEVALSTWFTFMAVSIILDRIPFVPNRDLLFFGLGLGMAGSLAIPEAELAGMLLAYNVMAKSLNILFLSLSFFGAGDRMLPSPETPVPTAEPAQAVRA
jgi:hypothetical protein